MTSRAGDHDREIPIDPTDEDANEVGEEIEDEPAWERNAARFLNWFSEDGNQGLRHGLAFWLVAIFVICCAYDNWKSATSTAEKWYASGKASADAVLTEPQQIAAVAAIGALVVYRIWRFIQIRRGIKPVPWLLIALTVFIALGFTLAATWLMFREASKAPEGAAAQLRFDAVKTGITLFAGTAGAGALILSFRSHFNSETDRLNSQFDTAADKMSNSSQVVQVAGILAVERIALKHKSYRRSAVALLSTFTLTASGYPRRQAIRVLRRFGERNFDYPHPDDSYISE
ncbi:hypothetical protein FHU28_000375 [Micromonospora echinospora]|uniref:Uncharacterized protein n=1 Tax=Micromonospora echinospora TaxID=1877 RepID=A0ABR6M590_MICEC|nr:hypothetical protein [Micromonospora echinospora]MBB5110536.1 hypothetical protein [Micromonospora echinospora]